MHYKTGGTFNEHVIIDWVNKIVTPYRLSNGWDSIYLIYDSAKCHLTPSVRTHLDKNNVLLTEVKPRLTNLIQPADVVLFAPYKKSYHFAWNDWFINAPKSYTCHGKFK